MARRRVSPSSSLGDPLVPTERSLALLAHSHGPDIAALMPSRRAHTRAQARDLPRARVSSRIQIERANDRERTRMNRTLQRRCSSKLLIDAYSCSLGLVSASRVPSTGQSHTCGTLSLLRVFPINHSSRHVVLITGERI